MSAEAELEAAKKQIAALKAENAELQVRVPRKSLAAPCRSHGACCLLRCSGFSSVCALAQALCIQTQAKLNEDAERHEKRDAELKELQVRRKSLRAVFNAPSHPCVVLGCAGAMRRNAGQP